MTTIQELGQQAQLAEAAYADFLDPSKTPADSLQTGDSKFSASQAAAFVRNWRVVDQYTSPPGLFGITDGTGFSGTLFERLDGNGNGTGQFTFALRGTQPGYADLAADVGAGNRPRGRKPCSSNGK